MSTVRMTRAEEAATMEAVRAGDRSAFGALAERHGPELRVHCYRMLASLEDAEDAVQETFLRAWRKRGDFAGLAPFRAWLYGIATNACLDAIARRRRTPGEAGAGSGTGLSPSEVPWLQPYPDRLLEGVARPEDEPEAALVARETIELAYLVAIQHLPPAQRAALVLRDVVGWSAKETAALLETSVPSVNSALQRARATLRARLPARRLEWEAGQDADAAERALVGRYMEATERYDVEALLELMRDDVRCTMPPQPEVHVGATDVVAAWIAGGFTSEGLGELRCLALRANMQPAVACYVRRPGRDRFSPMAIDVLTVAEGRIAEIVTMPLADVIEAAGLPREL